MHRWYVRSAAYGLQKASNNMKQAIWTALLAGAVACSGGDDWPTPDTSNDGPVLDDAEGSEYGTDEQAVVVAAGVLSAIVASPFGIFYENPTQPRLTQCGTGNGATGLVSCAGKALVSPGARFFTIATNSGDFQSRLQQFCTQFHGKVTGWQCTVSLFTGPTCPTNVNVCVRNTSVTFGGSPPVFDLRRYQLSACLAAQPAHSATFRGVSYSSKRCDRMLFDVDKVVMAGEAGVDYAKLANDVLFSVGMQAVGVGVTATNKDLAYSATWSVGVNPYKPHTKFMSNGQICRVGQYQGQEDGSYFISDAAGCAND